MTIRSIGPRLAVGLFAVGLFLLTAASAWAFSRENVLPDVGNYLHREAEKII